jgi:hypothetical protein
LLKAGPTRRHARPIPSRSTASRACSTAKCSTAVAYQ